MKVVCKKRFRNMEVGQITEFTERSRNLQESEFKGYQPIGSVILIDDFLTYTEVQHIPCFIYYEEFKECFCSLREYRKLKLKKINERS